MRVLEVEDPAEPVRSNLTAAEEEALLYGSDKEGEPGEARGTGEPGELGNADAAIWMKRRRPEKKRKGMRMKRTCLPSRRS